MFSLGAWETPFDVFRHHFLQSICEKNKNLLQLPKRFYFHFSTCVFSPSSEKKQHASPRVNMGFIFPNKQTHLLKNFKEGKAIQHHHHPPTLPNAGTPLSALSTKRLLISMTERDTNEWGWLRGPLGRLRVCLSTSGAIAADHSLPHCRGSPAGLSSDGYSGSDSFGGRARTHANGSLHTK